MNQNTSHHDHNIKSGRHTYLLLIMYNTTVTIMIHNDLKQNGNAHSTYLIIQTDKQEIEN